jgi:hypothetical protein
MLFYNVSFKLYFIYVRSVQISEGNSFASTSTTVPTFFCMFPGTAFRALLFLLLLLTSIIEQRP